MKMLLGFSLLALMAAGAAGTCANAQTYPARPVTFVVPFAPGGGTEFLARLLGQRLEQRFGKPFVIENRPGGGGVTGALSVARAAPDGYTILMAPSPVMAINVALHKKLPYDPAVDFVPSRSSSPLLTCSWSRHRYRCNRWPTSSNSPRPSPASSPSLRPGWARRIICLPSCSRA